MEIMDNKIDLEYIAELEESARNTHKLTVEHIFLRAKLVNLEKSNEILINSMNNILHVSTDRYVKNIAERAIINSNNVDIL